MLTKVPERRKGPPLSAPDGRKQVLGKTAQHLSMTVEVTYTLFHSADLCCTSYQLRTAHNRPLVCAGKPRATKCLQQCLHSAQVRAIFSIRRRGASFKLQYRFIRAVDAGWAGNHDVHMPVTAGAHIRILGGHRDVRQ